MNKYKNQYKNSPQNPLRNKRLRARRLARQQEALYSFDAMPDLEETAHVQRVAPVTNYDEVTSGATWPADQSVEDFIAAATESRHEEDEPDS